MTMPTVVPFALDVLVRVTLVLTVFGVAGYLMRGQAAALRHLVWSVAIAGCVALPLLSLVNPFTVAVLPPREAAPTPVHAPAPGPEAPRLDRFASAEHGVVEHAVAQTQLAGPSNFSLSASSEARIAWPSVLLVVWIAGTLLFVLRFMVGLGVVRRMVGRAVAAPDAWTEQASMLARRFGV